MNNLSINFKNKFKNTRIRITYSSNKISYGEEKSKVLMNKRKA